MSTETLQPRARQLPCSRASLGSHAPSPPAGERTRPTGDLGSPRCSREGQPPWRSVKQALPRALSVLSLGWVRARCSPQFWRSLPWKVDDHLGGGAGGGDRIFGQKKKHNVLEGLTFRTSSTFPSAIYMLRIVSFEISTHRQGRDPMNQVAGGTESRFAELSKLKKKKKKNPAARRNFERFPAGNVQNLSPKKHAPPPNKENQRRFQRTLKKMEK